MSEADGKAKVSRLSYSKAISSAACQETGRGTSVALDLAQSRENIVIISVGIPKCSINSS